MADFEKVKDYLLDMGFIFSQEIPEEELVVIDDEDRGIKTS